MEREGKLVADLSEIVDRDRNDLAAESQKLSHLKFVQAVAYKNMTNDYLLLNQRKEEKALFLNHIHMDVDKNT